MTPIEIKRYLIERKIERKIVSLRDIAIHFRMETDTVVPMLNMWTSKGKLKKYNSNPVCQKGCCKCDPAAMEAYEWIG